MIEQRPYGRRGLLVSSLGLGAAQLGNPLLSELDSATLLSCAIDSGITLLDTAPSYGLSEQRIGRHLGSRRERAVISTKLGYGVEGIEDWTGACISAGVDQALRVLATDRLDIAHLHSCPRATLERGDVVDALARARDAGKIRAIAYSGENEDLEYALTIPSFDGFMASLNLFDQRVIRDVLPRLDGRGFIAKRPSANHPWRFAELPVGDYSEEYWRRWRSMDPDAGGMEWGELAIRFVLSIPGVDSAIVGTGSVAHLRQNLGWAHAGKLNGAAVAALRANFRRNDAGWNGQV